LKKRKTQELIREIESRQIKTTQPKANRTAQEIPVLPTVTAVKPAAAVIQHQSVKKVVSRPEAPAFAALLIKALARSKHPYLIIGVVGFVLLTMIGTAASMAAPAISPLLQPPANMSALPVVTANDVIYQMTQAGLTMISRTPITLTGWGASDSIQIQVKQGGNTGAVVVLSYALPKLKVQDAFKLARTPGQFKNWQSLTASNVVILVSPGTDAALRAKIDSFLTQWLVAPYRPFLGE
jgi:hypothetical protein